MTWSDRVKSGKKSSLSVELMFEPGVVSRLCNVLDAGALVSFGVSRDGGSMSCTVTFNGAWDREWFTEPQPMHDWLAAAWEAILEEPAPAAGSSPNGAPRRGR